MVRPFADQHAFAGVRSCLLAALALVTPVACSGPSASAPEPPPDRTEPDELQSAPEARIEDGSPLLPALREPSRGLGSVTARIPGTSDVVGGVHLAAHHARITIRDGVAHTEVEEELLNDTDRVLEGRIVFPIPADATLARLALWVDSELIEGEVVERARADRIFRGIVDDTVRPRDPALLDVVAGGTLSLRVFPIPAKRSRKVLFAYDQVLRREAGVLRHVYRVSFGSDRPTPIDAVSVVVDGVTRLAAHDVGAGVEQTALDDVVTIVDDAPAVVMSADAPQERGGSAVIVRAVAADPDAPSVDGDVVVALDVSAGQTEASLAAQAHLAAAILDELAPDESFALLACDSACASFPAQGRSAPTRSALDGARRFLAGLEPGGASDPAGALEEAARRLDLVRRGQVVLLSDGTATAGELSVAAQLEHVSAPLAGVDVRVVGVGRSVDDRALVALASGLGATYDRFANGAPLATRVQHLAASRRAPIVRHPAVELPAGVSDPQPPEPLPTRAGEEVVVLARATATGLGDEAVVTAAPVARLWARERIAQLEARGDEANGEITALALRHHVLSRTTSLLVLENDRMFAEFGIPRTIGREPAEVAAPDAEGASGAISGAHATRAPMVRMGMTSVSGRLPPEAIQRIVRQNFGRFRACYLQGLGRNPTLAGRVVTRFVIDRSGAVSSVADGGSDLPDPAAVACVVRAFTALSFPQPEGGIVVVTYPIVFAGEGTGEAPPATAGAVMRVPTTSHYDNLPWIPSNSALAPRPWVPPPPVPPSVVHRAGDDAWLESPASDGELRRLAARVERDPSRRRSHQDLVRASLIAGRFGAAHAAAAGLVALDPDWAVARELLADAAAALGRGAEAARATEAASALDPRSVSRRLAAARAADAVGDARRACAHLRALGDLSRDHAARAAECRARGVPTFPDPKAGGFEVDVACDGGACPAAVAITPAGRVLSPWTSGAGAGRAAGPLVAGTYRTLIAAADGDDEPDPSVRVTVRALGSSFVAHPVDRGTKTAVISRVTIPPKHRRPFVRF